MFSGLDESLMLSLSWL